MTEQIVIKKREPSWKDQLTTPQKDAIEKIKAHMQFMIKTLKIPEDKCWFNQASLKRVTRHTLQALKEKKYLEEADYIKERPLIEYYRWTGKEE